VRVVVSRSHYAEYESSDQIGLLYHDFKKIEVKCDKKGSFNHIYYAIMIKIIFFFLILMRF